MPQSTITRARSVDRTNWEPVTVVAAPQNWIFTPLTPLQGGDLSA
jgi:hypothetical protein